MSHKISSNYSNQNSNPTVNITVQKSRRKVKNGKDVYLNSGQEFELELYNPTQKKILAKITLNGNLIDSGLILRPGERIFLERFLDTKHKFKFETYKVNDTEQNKVAIENNGKVKVEFFNEEQYFSSALNWQPGITWVYNSQPYYYQTKQTWNTGTGISNGNLIDNKPNTNFFCQTTATNTGLSFNCSNQTFSDKIETGRVEKGNESSQDFQNDYSKFNYCAFHTVEYQILPISMQNIEAKDLVKYCSECGKKLKKEWKFCSNCGTSISDYALCC